jgi:hypothetical protein
MRTPDRPQTLAQASHPRILHALLCIGLFSGAVAGAALFPKLLKQIPFELQDEYVLLTRMEPDKTQEPFTNAQPFAILFSNRVVRADGTVRPVTGVIRVSQKGTNVYMISFEDKSSWLITPGDTKSNLVILEPKPQDRTKATIFVVARKQKPAVAKRPDTNQIREVWISAPPTMPEPHIRPLPGHSQDLIDTRTPPPNDP